jgi:hypothetical protein
VWGKTFGNLGGEGEEVAGEVQATENGTDERHDDVLHHGIDDLAERATDDHTDGQIDDVAFQGKISEFSQHGHDYSLLASLPAAPFFVQAGRGWFVLRRNRNYPRSRGVNASAAACKTAVITLVCPGKL